MVSESSLSRRICVFKLIPKRTFWIFQPIWSMQRTSTFHHLLLHVMTIIFWFYQGFGWTLSLLKCRVNTFHPDFLSSQLWLWRRPCVILLFFKKSQWQLRRYHCGWYQTDKWRNSLWPFYKIHHFVFPTKPDISEHCHQCWRKAVLPNIFILLLCVNKGIYLFR